MTGSSNDTGQGQQPGITIHDLGRSRWAFAETFALLTAAELDLFGILKAGPLSLDEMVTRTSASGRGLSFLLDALVGMRFLVRQDERYGLAEGVADLLAPGEPGARELEEKHAPPRTLWRVIQHWLALPEAVRTGRPVRDVTGPGGTEFFKELVPELYAVNLAAARTAAGELKRILPRFDVSALDVAAGSGVFGIALAKAHSGVVVTALDHGEVLEVTREFVERNGLVARFHYLPGDLRSVEMPREFFDVAFLGHILHSEGEQESKRLLERVALALRPGGTLVIAEFLIDDDGNGPLIRSCSA